MTLRVTGNRRGSRRGPSTPASRLPIRQRIVGCSRSGHFPPGHLSLKAPAEDRFTALDEQEKAQQPPEAPPTATGAEVTAALNDLRTTWAIGSDAARAQVIAAIYDEVRINSDGTFPEDGVELGAEAVQYGLPRALPEVVSVPERTRTSDL